MKKLNKANEARKEKAINKQWNFRDHGIKSFKQLIDAGVFKSAEIEMVPQLKYNRAKYNRFTDHQAQEEYYRKCTEKTKKAYFLYYDEDISTEVSKYVFEYYNETRPTEIEKQFKESNLSPIFEIEVYHKDTEEEDFIIFYIAIQDNSFIAQHVPLTREEERSEKIAFKELEIDPIFSLDENLQELYSICIDAIITSDFYALSTE